MRSLRISVALAVLLVGCGDNSKVCGEGTVDMNGYCVADQSGECGPGTMEVDGVCTPVCTDGTIPSDTGCVIDPNACQDGTVLIAGECRDPSVEVTVDLEEGQEPNGLDLLGEASVDPAGVITLPAVGEDYVVHGTIVPADHDSDMLVDGDIDTYIVTTPNPALLHISADGLNGLVGGFAAIAVGRDDRDPLDAYQRLALSVAGDAAQRDIFLPAAGTYLLVIADTRTFLRSGIPIGPAGAPLEYDVSIENKPFPTPTAVTLANGAGTVTDTIGAEAKFYTAAMGTGFNEANLAIQSNDIGASLINFSNTTFKQYAAGPGNTTSLRFAAAPLDTSILVVDTTITFEYQASPFTLDLVSRDAVALSTSGGMATAPERGTVITNLGDIDDASAFYFDVLQTDQIVNISVVWNQGVKAILVDQNLNPVSLFTWGRNPQGAPVAGTATMTAYRGQMRFRLPGRYYFLVVEPAGNGATSITATSTISDATPNSITTGTPLANQPISDTFLATSFTYAADPVTTPWQSFDVTGANTGANAVTFLDPANAYGRLDPLTVSSGTRGAEPVAIFAEPFPQAGGAIGRILLDDPTENYLVHVHPNAPANGAKTVSLDFATRDFHDFMTIAAGSTSMATGETIAALGDPNLYFVQSAPGSRVTITIDNTQALTDLTLTIFEVDESARQTVNVNGLGADETALLINNGWTAFSVSTTAVTGAGYDVSVRVEAPVAYALTDTVTAFADACTGTGGTNQTTANNLDPDDDVQTINLPANFNYYGIPVTAIDASTNGFASFAGLTDAEAANLDIPRADGIDGIAAPYWDDLTDVVLCSKLAGTKLTVQWVGVLFDDGSTVVRTQLILDSADDSVEFVWDAGQQALGGAATIGIEDTFGVSASKLGFDEDVIVLGTNKKLTPQ